MIGNAAHELEALAASLSGQAVRQYACAFGCSILRPLSVELALKFLAYLRSGAAPGGHDLWCLYDGLDRETKEIIEVVDMRTRTVFASPPVSDILKANRNAFVSVRYPSLKSPPMQMPDWRALGRAHSVLVDTGNNPDFRALCPSDVKHV